MEFLESYTDLFGIQFAYSPEKISKISLSKAESIEDLKIIFTEANLSVLEIDKKRWLLRNNVTKEEGTTFTKGRVLDSEGTPLVSALLYTNSGKYSALTDENGDFILEIPADQNFEICCQYLGYKAQCLSSTEEIVFELEPLALLIEDIEIKTKKIRCNLDALDDKEVLHLKSSGLLNATLGNDVIRSVQMLGGVDATNDLSASINIRSTMRLQSLVTLDGIPIYNSESAFGMFSVLNPMVVTKAELYKNSMPLEYGEFTGGYLACEGLTSIQEKVNLSVDINTLNTSAAIQVPIGEQTQISAAIRKSNGRISNKQYYSKLRLSNTVDSQLPQFFERPENLKTALENSFGDAYFNISREWKASQSLNFSLFGNVDVSGSSYNYFSIFKRRLKEDIMVDEKFKQSKAKANIGMSLKYLKKFKSESEFMFLFYSSTYALKDTIKSSIVLSNDSFLRPYFYNSSIINQVRDNTVKFQYLTSQKNNWSTKIGVDFRTLNTDFHFRSNNITPFKQVLRVPSLTPYLGIGYNYNDIFIANVGLRNAIIPIKNPINFTSPRAKILLKLNDELHFKSSLSINQQFFRPIELERQLGQSTTANIIANTKDIPILRSAQATMGLNYFYNGFKLNADVFVRENDGILEQVLSMPGLNDENNVFGNNSYELFRGVNKVVGLDLTSTFEKDKFMGIMSYTLSKSEDNFDKLFSNKPIPDQNNRTHQVNFFGMYDMNPWTFSTTYVYGSGVYTLDRSALDQNIDRVNINPAILFTQLPAYRRWDLNVSYLWDTKIGEISLDFGIFNVMNNENVNSELYIYSLKDDNHTALGNAEINLLGRIWTLGVRYKL